MNGQSSYRVVDSRWNTLNVWVGEVHMTLSDDAPRGTPRTLRYRAHPRQHDTEQLPGSLLVY